MPDAAPAAPRRTDRSLARRLGAVLWPYRAAVGGALVLTVATALLGPLRPLLVQVAIDDHVATGDVPGLLRVVLWLALVLVAEGVFSFALTYVTQWVGQHALFDLRARIVRHIEHQRLAFFDRTPIGTLITRATSDIEALADLLSSGAVSMLGDLARLVFIAGFMLSLDLELGLVALASLPPMLVATEIFRRKMRSAYRETRTQVARMNAFLQEHVTGMSVVQIFGREPEEQRRFEDINRDHRDAQIQTVYYFAAFFPVVDLIAAVALAAVLWFGGTEAMRDALTVGTLVAFVQYVRMFFEPVRNLSDQLNAVQAAFAASERVFDLLDDDQALPIAAVPAHLPGGRAAGRIEFQNVWFAYGEMRDAGSGTGDGQTGDAPSAADPAHPASPTAHPPAEPDWVLRDVSFAADAGSTLALVGATGSGKTTILSLLLRFYEPQRGRILLDGIDVQTLPPDELRRQIGLVLQDVFLFSGTVEENVTLGDAAIPHERVVAAARLVGADRFIDRMPAGYASEVGERGGALSLGQRQLLSFVRTLLYDPAVLVLDEATSSIDTETEEAVQHAIDVLMDGRTAVVVAHRLSTVQHARQILVLHKGVVRERGSHQELLAADGLYRRLYDLQYAEQEA